MYFSLISSFPCKNQKFSTFGTNKIVANYCGSCTLSHTQKTRTFMSLQCLPFARICCWFKTVLFAYFVWQKSTTTTRTKTWSHCTRKRTKTKKQNTNIQCMTECVNKLFWRKTKTKTKPISKQHKQKQIITVETNNNNNNNKKTGAHRHVKEMHIKMPLNMSTLQSVVVAGAT